MQSEGQQRSDHGVGARKVSKVGNPESDGFEKTYFTFFEHFIPHCLMAIYLLYLDIRDIAAS